MAAEPPQDLPHLLHEALSQVGWNADPNALAQRVLRLDKGLPLEDEFAVICTWLGHCALVHKLDQLQAPKQSTDEFQIPDLLAVFERNGERVTCLVEVKGAPKPVASCAMACGETGAGRMVEPDAYMNACNFSL